MNKIRILPPNVANQIAAGEVVERPASIVKELVENSIDAGAKNVHVHIKRGGTEIIKIVDDGCGIPKDELLLSVHQHATSKVSSASDLAAIRTMGFRGEALASIASVTKFSITSKTQNQSNAYNINNHTGVFEQPQIAAGVDGVEITVKDIFYNVPARKKFMRGMNTESIQIEQMFTRIALGNFSIGFKLYKEDKLSKTIPACINDKQRQSRLNSLCGASFKDSRYIESQQNSVSISGWVAPSDVDRPQADKQFFFVNGRVVRDRLLSHAIKQAYLELNPGIRYPIYCLYIDLEPQAVDVNVHPTKNEVRFRDARVIHQLIIDTIQAALSDISENSLAGSVESECSQENGKGKSVNKSTSFVTRPSFSATERSNFNSLYAKEENQIGDRYASARQSSVHKPQKFYSGETNNVSSTSADNIVLQDKLLLQKQDSAIAIVDIETTWRNWLLSAMEQEFNSNLKLDSHALITPRSLSFSEEQIEREIIPKQDPLRLLAINFDRISPTQILLRSIPSLLRDYPITSDFAKVLAKLPIHGESYIGSACIENLVYALPFYPLSRKQLSKLLTNHSNYTKGKLLELSDLLELL